MIEQNRTAVVPTAAAATAARGTTAATVAATAAATAVRGTAKYAITRERKRKISREQQTMSTITSHHIIEQNLPRHHPFTIIDPI